MGVLNNGVLDGVRRITGKFRDLVVDGGLPGAPLGFRLRGATSYGPPSSGTWKAGDTVHDRTGNIWTCTAGGTPGTWSGAVIQLAPSADTTGAASATAINDAVRALGGPGVVKLAPTAPWYIKCGTVVVDGSGVTIDAAGCVIHATGTGDLFRMYDSSDYDSRAVHGGGLAGYPFIDGTATTGASCPWHAGDIFSLQSKFLAQNFTGSGSHGVLWDNQWALAEQMDADVWVSNCATHFGWTQNPAEGSTGCYGSFERGKLRLRFSQVNAGYPVFEFSNGVYFGGTAWEISGNAAGTDSGAVTTAMYYATGSTPSGSADGAEGTVSSNVAGNILSNIELADNGGSPWTYTPTTFKADGSCYFGDLTGRLDFGQAGNNFTPTSAVVGFYGETDGGDPNIVSQTSQAQLFQGLLGLGTYAAANALATNGTITPAACYIQLAPTGNITGIKIAAGSWDGQPLIVNNSSTHTVTFAASGSGIATNSETMAANTAAFFAWSVNTSLWYRVKVS
jgi:hypothetical protein